LVKLLLPEYIKASYNVLKDYEKDIYTFVLRFVDIGLYFVITRDPA